MRPINGGQAQVKLSPKAFLYSFLKLYTNTTKFLRISNTGDLAQMVERVLSMHEAQGSIPWFSIFWFLRFSSFAL